MVLCKVINPLWRLISMPKRILSLLLAVILMLPLSIVAVAPCAAEEYDFEMRLLYGGGTLDLGDLIFYAQDNGLYCREYGCDSGILVVDMPASYLNYHDGKIWFISDCSVMSCLPDGSGLDTELVSDMPISHLYVCSDGLYYLKGDTVYLKGAIFTKKIFTGEGIAGFYPESENSFLWIVRNPNYIDSGFDGDEYWGGEDEFLFYRTDTEGDTVPVYDSCLGSDTDTYSSADSYTGPYVEIGNVTLPLEQHMPGTFFSKNGRACTCHYTSSNYCIESVGNCNCMRYYPTGYASTCEIDLLGAQCFAFARMVFYTCFGFIDHSMNASLYYSVGGLSSGNVTAKTVKELLTKAAPGAHVRLAAGHSVSILTMDEDFIVIYHGNAGGDGVTSQPCIVSTRRYTWEQFATACAKGILYVNMPYNYPDSSVINSVKEVGFYRLNSNLNLRSDTNTQADVLTILPKGEIVLVTEVNGFWGKVSYGGYEGWIFLEYTTYYSRSDLTPSPDGLFSLSSDGKYIVTKSEKLSYDSVIESFDKQNIVISSLSGEEISAESGTVGTGCTISVVVGGESASSATVIVLGDINGNGRVDIGDYLMIRRHLLDTYTLDDTELAAADVISDGEVTTSDYIAVKRYFLGNMTWS